MTNTNRIKTVGANTFAAKTFAGPSNASSGGEIPLEIAAFAAGDSIAAVVGYQVEIFCSAIAAGDSSARCRIKRAAASSAIHNNLSSGTEAHLKPKDKENDEEEENLSDSFIIETTFFGNHAIDGFVIPREILSVTAEANSAKPLVVGSGGLRSLAGPEAVEAEIRLVA